MKKYIRLMIDGKRVLYHRYKMLCYIGRLLNKNLVVHHIDGDTLNNNIENLKIMLKNLHQLLHITNISTLTKIKMKKPRSEETKRKISEARLGKKLSLLTKKNMSQSQKGKHFGTKSELAKQNMSKARTGIKHSLLHKQNISNGLKLWHKKMSTLNNNSKYNSNGKINTLTWTFKPE